MSVLKKPHIKKPKKADKFTIVMLFIVAVSVILLIYFGSKHLDFYYGF